VFDNRYFKKGTDNNLPRKQGRNYVSVERAMMILWEAQSQASENAKNLSIIANWWKSLDKKSVLWKQRIIPEKGEIDWDPQKFDDTFVCVEPDVRGITLYWKKEEEEAEKNITPAKLEFNPTQQHVFVYPETQKDVVISVEIPGVVRETLQMKNPAWFSERMTDEAGDVSGYRLVIHDTTNLVEVQIDMDEGSLNYLKSAVNGL
jgi:hypothetical protein